MQEKRRMKIVIIGYRASGKSTVGRLVAEALGWPLRDIDRGIEQACNATIAEIFAKHGEAYFRQVEHQVIEKMCTDQTVVSLGGGAIMTPANETIAREDSWVVYLKASVDELWKRIEADPATEKNRPDLSCGGKEEVAELLAQRQPVYERSADLVLDATQPPQELAQIIVEAIRR